MPEARTARPFHPSQIPGLISHTAADDSRAFDADAVVSVLGLAYDRTLSADEIRRVHAYIAARLGPMSTMTP